MKFLTYKIGILGAGNVGSTLGLKWASKSHTVTFGVRTPEKYADFAKNNPTIKVKMMQELLESNDVLVLAVPGKEAGSILSSLGNLEGKLVIDATNMYGLQKLQEQFPKTHFVKAFNTIGYNIMEKPTIGSQKASLLYCGNNEKLLDITNNLAKDCGFDPFLVGDNTFAGDLESFALLWIKMSRKIGREFAFKLLK